jgi:type I restriction enzyme S subunit
MKSERLLDGFSLLGDEPATIQQFRKLVVGLAISGKLVVDGDKTNDPVRLLKRIEESKAAQLKQGSFKQLAPAVEISQLDLPNILQNSSIFVRLGSVSRIEKGVTGIMKAERGPYPLVVTAEDRLSCDHYDFDGTAAIVPLVSSAGHGKASLQRLHYQEGKFALGSILAAIFPFSPELLSARFLFEYLTAFKEELLVTQMIGTANVSLSVGKLATVPVPLVSPLVQQKVDELMALCDRLEAARAEREATRDRLAASSLARLNAPDPESFQDNAHFVLNALPALTTRPDQIKQLRQTTLNLAVRGKLVQQSLKDEPAAQLLKRISAQKARLVKSGDVRRLEVDPIDGDEKPFKVPENWTWTRLGSIGDWGSGSTPPRGNTDFYGGGISWLKSGELNDNRQLAGSEETVTKLALERGSFRLNRPGDVLIAMYGATIGKVAILKEKAVTNQAVCGCTPFEGVFNQFLFLFLLSQRQQFHSASEGGAQPNISKVKIVWTPFPLPPLAEQHRIVSKVDELMVLFDQLEASLTDSSAIRRRLLDALLAEALEPAEVHEVEAMT